MIKKPDWIKRVRIEDPNHEFVRNILDELKLNTICHEALCPNAMECFAKRTASFMIMGVNCTRNCRFCNVRNSAPQGVDLSEPERLAEAVERLGLKYVVVTSVTRDDLPDGGAAHFAAVIQAIRRKSPHTAIEVLIPDFQGDMDSLRIVADAGPTVISHNMETVKYLYDLIRPQAIYERSLHILESIKKIAPIHSKTGVMVGLGETPEQIHELMDELRAKDCEFLTIGQYLAPSSAHYPVREYVTPQQFESYARIAREKGFLFVASSPFVRSSYNASEAVELL